MGLSGFARIAGGTWCLRLAMIRRGFLRTALRTFTQCTRGAVILEAAAGKISPGTPALLLFPIARPAALALPVRLPLRPKERKPVIVPAPVRGVVRAPGRSVLGGHRPLS